MRRLLLVAMVLALLAPTAAFAAPVRHHPPKTTTTTTKKPRPTTTTQPTTTTVHPTTTTGGGSSSGWAQNATWQWQLTGTVDTTVAAQVFDIDGFDNTAATVAKLHAQGSKVICYIDVGTWENWRSDAASFPDSVKGKSNGWPGEKWLDIRSAAIRPILDARFQMCASKGFDAVEPDNVDGYDNSTGFPLTANDQVVFNEWFASAVHAHGMTVALKNDVDQVKQLAPSFDFAINEQCWQYDECSAYSAFTSAHKWVGEVEYKLDPSKFCTKANAAGFMAMQKHLSLDAYRVACWA